MGIIKKIVLSSIFLAFSLVGFAQSENARPRGGDGWMRRMEAERIAFLTREIGLTPQEAQVFWPIYNKAEAEEREAFGDVMKAYNELRAAVDQKKTDKEISVLLHIYTNAVSNSKNVDAKYVSQYERILSAEKVAKLYIAEENFRNNQIYRLQGRDHAPSNQGHR